MLQRRELTQVIADTPLAERLLATARQHLLSAEALASTDAHLAYAALHDAVRKSLAALLQIQGLRATATGGHLAIQHATRAQSGASMGPISARSTASAQLATRSNTPTTTTWIDEDGVRDDLPIAIAVVDAADKALPHLTVFVW
ncbi:hypothetical protein Acor_40250 [Acrocarpospora corrugata]|uniref:HEPN domain-containing protein n=2 Tax=Acrocarpospora corrugata TaxID=35763 RepID=A0A5M3W160_9ACTN|nr:hypothetical protein Acor_40250 [Acrocarpospora corrugata]